MMKSTKLALLGGAALAVTSTATHADDLDALKAQIETLNARVAAMEAAPAVPAGYSLLAISEGPRVNTPGLPMTSRQEAAYGSEATYISVLPTADARAGAIITWSGYAKAGLIYTNESESGSLRVRDVNGDSFKFRFDSESANTDLKARAQLRVTASTDTAVGEVGVDIRIRADFDGNGEGDVYSDIAWGYWSMTPELTFGGGYASSLGDIGYGYDGACTCYFTDRADVGFNPGDVTQLRLTYASGALSMAIALEDASIRDSMVIANEMELIDYTGPAADSTAHGDKLGAAGEIKYAGGIVTGEISGVWRDRDDVSDAGITDLWQIGAGLGFALGDMATLSLAGAFGEGPFETVASNSSPDAGEITTNIPINQRWWGLSALASANLSDAIHAEIGAGYKYREQQDDSVSLSLDGFSEISDTKVTSWGVLGGIYYDPVDQLTIGVEGEYWSNEIEQTITFDINSFDVDATVDNFQVDFVSVWRF
jgi:opacity protein-like surface antigen